MRVKQEGERKRRERDAEVKQCTEVTQRTSASGRTS